MARERIYTRTGDDGTTGLFYGSRVRKDSELPAAYGTVDEATAALGMARAALIGLHGDGIAALDETTVRLVPALAGSPANLAFPFALVLAVAVGVLLFRTRRGYELRALGLNAPAAAYGGVAIGATQVVALALAGALAGLGGCNFVLGYKHFFELGFTAGAGFLGIAVALLGRNSPLGVVVAALLFGALSYGGLIVNERVPRELIEVLEALVILCAITARPVLERLARRLA